MKIFDPAVPYTAIENTSVFSIMDAIKQGVRFSLFSTFASKSPFSLSEWSGFLHISERTMQRYQRDKKKFEPLQSEKIIEIVLVFKKGIEVFGSEKNFYIWLDTANISLGNQKPKQLFDNSFGINLLKDELTKIEHGILA